MKSDSDPQRLAAEKMRAAGQSDEAIRAFSSALERVRSGAGTLISSSELEPAPGVPALDELPEADPGQALAGVALVKLNGGLATSMGLNQPKTLLEAREGRSFLEIIIGQTLALRRRHGVRLPLVLMNSQATREPTLAALAEHPEIGTEGIPWTFSRAWSPSSMPTRWRRSAGRMTRRWSGTRPDTATCTPRYAAQGCSPPCWSRDSATR